MPRAGLTAAAVVETASQIADEEGWEALSLPLVAARCGVKPPSLYKHVASLGALKEAVAADALDALATIAERVAAESTPQEALGRLAHGYRAYALRHPGRYAATVQAAPETGERAAAAERALEAIRRALAVYHLEGDDLVHGVRAVRATVHGFVLLELAGGFGMPQSVDASFERLIAGLDAALRGPSM